MLASAWHALIRTCDIYGRVTLPLSAALAAWLLLEMRRARRRGRVTDAEIAEALRAWAGDPG